MKPYLQDHDFTLYNGDACEVLAELPDESVHMCVTSPPFFGLRDYQTGSWEGGDAECDHSTPRSRGDDIKAGDKQGTSNGSRPNTLRECKCGATRVDRQIGLESTPEAWVASLVSVFEQVRRVLRKDGVLFVECGDSYAGSWGAQSRERLSEPDGGAGGVLGNRLPSDSGSESLSANQIKAHPKGTRTGSIPAGSSLKPKDLIGQPFLLAFALREAGWYWRNVLIWHKPNPMPESVRDRFTVSHSYVLLFSKSPRYFFDAEAVRESDSGLASGNGFAGRQGGSRDTALDGGNGTAERFQPGSGRNARSVWSIATEPLPFEHYAAFPQALAERCIKAGTSERGCCPECGAPWVREVEATKYEPEVVEVGVRNVDESRGDKTRKLSGSDYNKQVQRATTGWRPSCECVRDLRTAPVGHGAPCTVLDPFMGSGTTALTARRLGRRCIGVELNPKYCALSADRTKQLSLEASA